jgi:hypothetical protein
LKHFLQFFALLLRGVQLGSDWEREEVSAGDVTILLQK